jgi:hypothetical protein
MYDEVCDPVYRDAGTEYRFVAEHFGRIGSGETYGTPTATRPSPKRSSGLC